MSRKYEFKTKEGMKEMDQVDYVLYLLKNDPDRNFKEVIDEIETIMEGVEGTTGAETTGKIIEILREAAKLAPAAENENYQTQLREKANALTEEFKKLYGYTDTEGKHVDGMMDNLEKDLIVLELNSNIKYNPLHKPRIKTTNFS